MSPSIPRAGSARDRLRAVLLRTPGAVPTIAASQLLATSLWFSANSEAARVLAAWHAPAQALGWMSSAVQLGFIVGTLGLSLGGLADRYRASSVFVASACAGALVNAWLALSPGSLASGLLNRWLLGLCLAGIYPLGMKLIVTWAAQGVGSALAQLVAMLTLGTALPQLLHVLGNGISWHLVVLAASLLALVGACMIGVLGDGPNAMAPRVASRRGDSALRQRFTVGLRAFGIPGFRSAAMGYFGHMWELYAFWVAVPTLVGKCALGRMLSPAGIWMTCFCVMAMGAVGCLAGGFMSRRFGSPRVAAAALALSGLCCAAFALTWRDVGPWWLLGLLLLWGAAVVADSPQFSAVAAATCPPDLLGSALALQNSIGFALTVVAIPAFGSSLLRYGLDATWLLLPGPILGLVAFLPVLQCPDLANPARRGEGPSLESTGS